MQLSAKEWKLLGETFFFQNAEEALLQEVKQHPDCGTAEYTKGQIIFSPQTFSRSLGVVLSGRVQVSKEGLLVSVLEPGELFGAAALFNEREDYAATLTARTKCRLLLLPQTLVAELMAHYPTLAANYIRYLSGRIRFLEGKLDGLLAGSAERKLAQYLLGGGGEDCSLTDVAGRLGVSRASLYRALDALCKTGVIHRDGKHIRVADRERLAEVR